MSQATLGETSYRNAGLFTNYYLDNRVQDLDEWDCDDVAQTAFKKLQTLWDREGDLVGSYDEDELIDEWIQEVVEHLGYETRTETTLPDGSGFTDLLLYESETERRKAAESKRDGDVAASFATASAVLEAKQWGAAFDERFSEQRSYLDASDQLDYYLKHTPEDTDWGILTNGKKWRLYGTKDYATKVYYEVDLPELLVNDDLEAFKYFFAFFRPEAFHETAGTCFLDAVWNESELAAKELGEDLQDSVFRAMRVLAEGFVETNDLSLDVDDDQQLAELKEQSLVLLYRMMFVLYAESRGLIEPDDSDLRDEYAENFGLNTLRQETYKDVKSSGDFDDFSEFSTTTWSRLENLFNLVDTGEEQLDIPAYNGGLFDPEDNQFLTENDVADRYLAEAIYLIGTVENDDEEDVLADYSDLNTRHLGSIYEGLLEHEFRIAPEDYAAVADDGGQVWKSAESVAEDDVVEAVESGDLYVVNDDGERKATGAYYTPEYVVSYIVEETTDPLLAEIHEDLRADGLEESDREYLKRFYESVRELTVLDPAMGSGHFLTTTVQYLTQEVMNVYQQQAEGMSEKEAREFEESDDSRFSEKEIKRALSKECIYGVDVNEMAVELAKVSMWLETLAADKPLAFLDHHLKAGNSLVGSNIYDVLSEGTQTTLSNRFRKIREETLDHVRKLMDDLVEIDNDELDDIKRMEQKYEEIRGDPLYRRLLELANVHTAERFGLDVPDGVYATMAGSIKNEDEWQDDVVDTDWFSSAQVMAIEEGFFHWELEFPEVFLETGEESESGGVDSGFDAVVANPPYIRIQELRTNTPRQAEYYLNEYQSSTGNFDIYTNFTEKGYSLTNNGGFVGHIQPHKFFQSEFGRGIRGFLSDKDAIHKILSFGHGQVFENASVYTCVLILSKSNEEKLDYSEMKPDSLHTSQPEYHSIEPDLDSESWSFQSPEQKAIVDKIESAPETLESAAKKIYQGVITSADDIYLVEKLEEQENTAVVENGKGESFQIETELLYPFLKGEDVHRYSPPDPPNHVVLPYDTEGPEPRFIPENILESDYPHAYEYFSENESSLRERDSGGMDHERWYDFTRAQNMGEFLNQKLVTPDISYGGNFTVDTDGMFHKSAVYGVVADDWLDEKYLLSLLNSNLLWFYLQGTGNVLRGGYFRFKTDYLEPFGVHASGNSESLDQETRDAAAELIDEVAGDIPELLSEAADVQLKTSEKYENVNTNLRDYLGAYSDGRKLTEIGFSQPVNGVSETPVTGTTESHPKLQITEITVKREDNQSVVLVVDLRYKPEDAERGEYESLGSFEAIRISDLSETEAGLIESYVPYAVENPDEMDDYRNNATKNITPRSRLRDLTLPRVADVEQGLASYREAMDRAAELERQIERTDDLIDEIVYELYGLTDEEIEIVEESVEE